MEDLGVAEPMGIVSTPAATDLESLLRSTGGSAGTAAYLQTARRLREFAGDLRRCRVALAGSFTLNPLVPFLQVESAKLGFAVEPYVAPFNSVSQELLSPESGCVSHQPDVVFVSQLLEDVCAPLANDFLALDASAVGQHLGTIVADLIAGLQTFRRHSSAAVVIHNFVLPPHPLLGIQEVMESASQTAAIRAVNGALADALRAVPGAYVLDCDRLAAEIGYQNWQDPKMWYLARAALSSGALKTVARAQARLIRSVMAPPRKCLVLDLDNTLWGGVLGEVGRAGIQLGPSYPGNVFRDFQRAVLSLHRRGVLLAINSKNNLTDVEEVFRSHPDMVLKSEHFASMQVNWRPKPDNMQAIASELALGLDSFVFVDDDAAECGLMRDVLPQVLTLQAESQPLARMEAVLNSGAFDKVALTDEDRRRGELYRSQTERDHLRNAAGSVAGFLRGLQMEIAIRPVDDFSLPRVLDLIHKTNQFNLTTRRHSAAELSAMIAGDRYGAFTLRVADRFGDSGMVGVALIRQEGDRAYLDTFLLSCRVIGRTVETAFLAFVLEWARARGIASIDGQFIPTAKNAPAAEFFSRHGFIQTGATDGRTDWQLRIDEARVQWPDYIRRTDETRDAS